MYSLDQIFERLIGKTDLPINPRSRRSDFTGLLMILGLCTIPFFFYSYTMAPGMGLGDTALLLEEILNVNISTHVNNHNITVLLGRLFQFLPFGSIAFKGNLMSVFAGSVAVLVFAGALMCGTGSIWATIVGSAAFMVSRSQWWHSTIVECYAVNAIFTGAALWILTKMAKEESRERQLPRLFFLAGLSLFNHVQLGFIAVGSTVILLLQLPRSNGQWMAWFRLALRSTLWFVLGFLPYAVTFILDAGNLGFGAAARAATGGQFQSLMFQGDPIQAFFEVFYLLTLQFPSPFFFLMIAGLFLLMKNWPLDVSLGLASMFLLNTGFFMFFNTWDRFAFLLPSFLILSYAGGYALHHLVEMIPARQRGLRFSALAFIFLPSVILPPWLYGRLADWGSEPGLAYLRWNNSYTLNSHRASEFVANPNKRHWNDVELFTELLFAKLPQGAVYLDDDSRTYYPLAFAQSRLHRRLDLNIRMINSWGFSGWGVESAHFGPLLLGILKQKGEVFLVSTDRPFVGVLTGMQGFDELLFERFYLDDRHWVYRVTLDGRAALKQIPALRRMYTGRPTPGGFIHTASVHRSGPLGIMAEIDTNFRPLKVAFRWFGPDKTVRFESKPFTVSPGNTGVWSLLQKDGLRDPGAWSVQFLIDGQETGKTDFTVSE